jgi:hypothetical protein
VLLSNLPQLASTCTGRCVHSRPLTLVRVICMGPLVIKGGWCAWCIDAHCGNSGNAPRQQPRYCYRYTPPFCSPCTTIVDQTITTCIDA